MPITKAKASHFRAALGENVGRIKLFLGTNRGLVSFETSGARGRHATHDVILREEL